MQLNLSNLIFYFLGKSNKNINTLQKKNILQGVGFEPTSTEYK